MVEYNFIINDLRRVKFSATPNNAWKDICIAVNVESNIILTALKDWTTDCIDSKAGREFSAAAMITLKIMFENSIIVFYIIHLKYHCLLNSTL
jgi:hypothetical protein